MYGVGAYQASSLITGIMNIRVFAIGNQIRPAVGFDLLQRTPVLQKLLWLGLPLSSLE